MAKKNHADKRSVSTDALETLGTAPLKETEARDAIHLAVEPVIAGEKLFAGQDIGLVQSAGGLVAMRANKLEQGPVKALGIVDPFLEDAVYPGDRFWLVVYPRQIKSLRHVWEHPDFPAALSEPEAVSVAPVKVADPQEVSRAWIENYANGSVDMTYNRLMEAAREYLRYGEHVVEGGRYEGFYLNQEFWDHYEVVTGETVNESDRGSFFSCSC